MISKKKLLSVAAAVAISSSMVSADYLPLTSTTAEDNWIMFGVTGFHANGAVTGAAAGDAVDAGTFSITGGAGTDNTAIDSAGDDLYGEEGAVPTGEAILDGGVVTEVLASVKRIDPTSNDVEVRVDVSNITYFESDPVRTIYVKQKVDDEYTLFAFSYKSALEGEKLEFTTSSSGTTDDAYRITINSENTYNNPAIAEYIPAIEASGGTEDDAGSYLTSINDLVDYDFADGPESPNPIISENYLKVDHQDTVGTGESLRLYSYNPSGIWEMYDSRNTFQDFTELQKGKGYWGKMDLNGVPTPAGFVLGNPSIETQDYLDSGIAEGWNLLAFNADNAELRAATTGLIVPLAANGSIILSDVSGNHSVTIALSAATTEETSAREINQAMKEAKINGLIPDTFNIVAIPTAAATVALISDEKFSFTEEAGDTVVTADILTLAGDAPLNAATLEDHAGGATEYVAASPAMSKYGEYALIVEPQNVLYAELDIKCDSLASETVLPTQGAIEGATCIDKAYDLDTDYDSTADNHILMVADEPFEIRDHTFARVFDYTVSLEDGEITAVNADTTFTAAAAFSSSVAETQTLTITADDADDADETMTVTYGTNTSGGTASTAAIALGAINSTDSTAVAAAVSTALNNDATFSAIATATSALAVVTITYDDLTVVGLNINTTVSAAVAGTTGTLAGAGADVTPGSQQTATQVVAQIEASNAEFDDTANTGNITADGTQILIRTKATEENQFRILETADGDNLTPSSTTNAWAQGAISDVFSPNSLVKAALENVVTDVLTDNTDPVEGDKISFTLSTPLASITTESYEVVASDVGDSDAFYANLQNHLNEQYAANALDTTIAFTAVAGGADYGATMTHTGTDVTGTGVFTTTGTFVVNFGGYTQVNGTPTIGDGDMTEDLKFNFLLSPNYVLDGPLYEMKAAGFTAKAMVTGTMDNTGTSMGWDGIDLSRKPSEWLLSQDYNLFTVDNAAGYWTYLEVAEANPLTFEAAPFNGNYTQHFNQDGKTYNQVGGAIEITINGISDYDDRKSARVVALVGGTQVELSRDGLSETYTGQISSRELKSLDSGKEHDILVVVADGLGYRIPATPIGTVVDFKAPSEPTLTFNAGTVAITNDVAEAVTQYYVYNNDIPATGTESAKLTAISAEDAAAYNLCGSSASFNRTTQYDLKFIALDGDSLLTSNASDAYQLDGYMAIFKNAAIITNTRDGAPTSSLADIKYDNSCTEEADAVYDQSIQASSRSSLKTIKVSYEPKAVGTSSPITVFVDGGTETTVTAAITYNPDYEGDIVFVQLGARMYSYELPSAATAIATTEESPISLSTAGTYLDGQTLGE